MGNSRQLKFRAWDKKNHKWHEGWARLLPWGTPEGDSKHIILDIMPGHFEFNQFTGLRDEENDIEIYDGDVVSMHQFLFEGNEVEKIISGVVGWNEYGLTLTQIRNKFVEEYCGYDAGEGEISLSAFYGLHENSWTVLGNIHENPELVQ